MKFFLERSSSSETPSANPSSGAISPAKKETGAVEPAISRSSKHSLLTLQGDTAVPINLSAAAHQDNLVKEPERSHKTLKQQRSNSEGVLEKQPPEPLGQSRAHHSRRSSAAAAIAAPVGFGIGGASRLRMYGNPLTKSLDADPPGKRLAGTNHFITEKQEDSIVEREYSSKLSAKPPCPGQQRSSSHRKDAAVFGSRQPAATAMGLGARTSRHHKFRPRGPADLEVSQESEATEESLSPSQRRIAGGSRLLENKKLLQTERPFVTIPVAELEKEDDGDSFGGSGRELAAALSSEMHKGVKTMQRQPKLTSAMVQVQN